MGAIAEIRENTDLGRLTAHLEALERRHRILDGEEAELRRHVGVSDEELADLGKRKLRLRDRIEEVRRIIATMRREGDRP